MTQEEALVEIKNLVEGAELSLKDAKQILIGLTGGERDDHVSKAQSRGGSRSEGSSQIIEGVFDGQHMVGPDGKQYSVPANYASKSKLVEGDLMKLTIDRFGNFLYKQIGPMERARLKGKLVKDESTSEWRVVADGKSYKVLLASVTYFKGEEGDQVTILVPKDKSSTWAAVENIISNPTSEEDEDYEGSEEPKSSIDSSSPSEPGLSPSASLVDGNQSGNKVDTPTLSSLGGADSLDKPFGVARDEDSGNEFSPDTGFSKQENDASSDAPQFGGNVPEYSPEPQQSDNLTGFGDNKDDVEPEGNGLGGGLGNMRIDIDKNEPNSSGSSDDSARAGSSGYKSLSFDDDEDEFQVI